MSSLEEIVEDKKVSDVVKDLEPKDMDAPKALQEKLILKPLPDHLKYAYLGKDNTKPIILSASLTSEQEDKLLKVLRMHETAIGWTWDKSNDLYAQDLNGVVLQPYRGAPTLTESGNERSGTSEGDKVVKD